VDPFGEDAQGCCGVGTGWADGEWHGGSKQTFSGLDPQMSDFTAVDTSSAAQPRYSESLTYGSGFPTSSYSSAEQQVAAIIAEATAEIGSVPPISTRQVPPSSAVLTRRLTNPAKKYSKPTLVSRS
jgi:hypothetical protein